MKKMKILALILAVVFAASMLSACGSNTGNTTATTQSSSTTASQSTAPASTTPATTQQQLAPVELQYYFAGQTANPPDTVLVEQEMDKILTAKINATIKLNFIPFGDYVNKMNVIAASGQGFDIAFSAGWLGYNAMASKDAYADMTDLLPKYCADYLKEMPDYVVKAGIFNGKQYAAPNLQGLGAAIKLGVNSEIFDKYNMPSSIKSMDELDTYMDAIKKGEPGMTPIYGYAGTGSFTTFLYDLQAFYNGSLFSIGDIQSVGWYGPDFKVVDEYETDTAKAGYAYFRKAYQKGWVSKGAATFKDDGSGMKAKKYAMMFINTSPQYDANQNMTQYAPVKLKYVDLGMKPTVTTSGCIATMLSIGANSKNKERAAMYINLINTDKDLYNTLCYGIKDRNYTASSDGTHFGRPSGVTDANNGYNPGINWAFGFTYNALLPEGVDPAVGQQQLDFDKSATPEPALGFVFDPSPVKTELANTETVLDETAPSLEAGALDPTTGLQKLIDGLKKAGMDNIIAEKQKQLDAWRAANGK